MRFVQCCIRCLNSVPFHTGVFMSNFHPERKNASIGITETLLSGMPLTISRDCVKLIVYRS